MPKKVVHRQQIETDTFAETGGSTGEYSASTTIFSRFIHPTH
jgi:hypothetical protein